MQVYTHVHKTKEIIMLKPLTRPMFYFETYITPEDSKNSGFLVPQSALKEGNWARLQLPRKRYTSEATEFDERGVLLPLDPKSPPNTLCNTQPSFKGCNKEICHETIN